MSKYTLMGLDEETRLALEEASKGTIPTEAGRVLVEASVRAAGEVIQKALETATKEVQEVIGPHGSVTRLQAGGVQVTRGEGVAVYKDGVKTTAIAPAGKLATGSDITQPATTTFLC